MKKDNARILFNVDDEGIIIDLIVAEFQNPTQNSHLHDLYRFDMGNANFDWKDCTFQDVIISLFFQYTVKNERKLIIKILNQLSKIDEFKEILDLYIYIPRK